jgi:hypothetical protein
MRARLGKARQCPRNRERDLDYPTQSDGPDCLGSRVGSPEEEVSYMCAVSTLIEDRGPGGRPVIFDWFCFPSALKALILPFLNGSRDGTIQPCVVFVYTRVENGDLETSPPTSPVRHPRSDEMSSKSLEVGVEYVCLRSGVARCL